MNCFVWRVPLPEDFFNNKIFALEVLSAFFFMGFR